MLDGPLSFSRRVGGAITRFKVTVVMSSKSLWSHVLFSSLMTGLSLGDLGHSEIHVFFLRYSRIQLTSFPAHASRGKGTPSMMEV